MNRLVLLFTGFWVWQSALAAQLPATGSNATPTGMPSLPGSQGTNSDGSGQTPSLPGMKTPAQEFRELLAMTPSDREKALSDRTASQRKTIQKQLWEYQAMPEAEREERLKRLEFKWVWPIVMKLPPTNRAQRLMALSPEVRRMVEESLANWDKLPPDDQKRALDLEARKNLFVIPPPMPSGIDLPGQTSMQAPTVADNRKDLEAFLQANVQGFNQLDENQRVACIENLDKLRKMKQDQREAFLAAAERWKAMPPVERATWQNLMRIMPPTLPPFPPKAAANSQLSPTAMTSSPAAAPGVFK